MMDTRIQRYVGILAQQDLLERTTPPRPRTPALDRFRIYAGNLAQRSSHGQHRPEAAPTDRRHKRRGSMKALQLTEKGNLR